MSDTILLTGGTGFLGTELAERLVRDPDTKLYILIRAADPAAAMHRLEESLYFFNGVRHHTIHTIPVCGDFSRPGLGLSDADRILLQDEVTLVLHAGAEIGFQKSRQELADTNVEGTKNMLAFASGIRNLRRFVHISTAYVAGRKTGLVLEDELGDMSGNASAASFSSFYEQSKAQAEALVRESGLPFSICRPGMIVGDSRTGWVRNFNTIYYVLKLMLQGKLPVLPIRPDAPLNLVPVDYVADSVVKICDAEEAAGKTFHLTCPQEAAPQAGVLSRHIVEWARDNLAVNLPMPVFTPLPALGRAGLLYNKKEKDRKKNSLSNMLTLLPYFFSGQDFDRTNTDRICGSYEIKWWDYIDKLLAFACRKNFMRQTGQTVFEQAQVRRASRRYPICYYDVAADGIRKTTGPEVNARIETVLAALRAWGIHRGDRVALTGINSVDYLVLEQAIGLLGAVSVPLYYTTPAAESTVLLQKSGAKWFFVGDKRMMTQVPQIETDAQIVTFSVAEEEATQSTSEPGRVMHWQDFLAKANTCAPVPESYPAPDDLATIRYTSGTTGEPKGVTFTFAQLAWMGEVLTNLIPWKDRSRPFRYLSFLPLSHVVEGILASYAPYYVLSKVDYYYLNDFNALTDALPQVRPTIFFSVPRFYEKLWDQIAANKIGQTWLAEQDGVKKRALGAVLKKAALRKAGVDRCKQLIVGSAPMSEALLLHFRELGIEIHNAYGQTEAPLITINRMGDNVIPTIGTPLPDTIVTAEPDGELIVTGPQVTPGYYGLETETIRPAAPPDSAEQNDALQSAVHTQYVLRTGDLGRIDKNGHITLFGRKKDFIVTAYGKNISITKLETKLKDIPGVSEAVLIGENRPYCTALLWLEEDATGKDTGTAPGKTTGPDSSKNTGMEFLKAQNTGVEFLRTQIDSLNAGLSHPEQIRSFRIIDKPLSIQAGELTPNLKVKRRNVEAHLADIIDEMYS